LQRAASSTQGRIFARSQILQGAARSAGNSEPRWYLRDARADPALIRDHHAFSGFRDIPCEREKTSSSTIGQEELQRRRLSHSGSHTQDMSPLDNPYLIGYLVQSWKECSSKRSSSKRCGRT
jgi:hypothetical protein